MLPVRHQMVKPIVSLIEERAATVDKLRQVDEMERFLAEVERRLVMERAAMDDLYAEVADKGKQLQGALAWQSDLVA